MQDKSQKRQKQKGNKLIYIVVGLIVAATVLAFVIGINLIVSGAETRGRRSLEVFAEQTSLRLEDMLESNSNVMYQLRFVLSEVRADSLDSVQKILQGYRENWGAEDVGLLREDGTAIGADGVSVEFETPINPLSVTAFAYGVYIDGNRVGEDEVLSFAIYSDMSIDGERYIGLFMNYPLSKINTMMENTEYGNDKSTFIAVVDRDGDTIWKSGDTVGAQGVNLFDDLKNAQFENKGEFDRISQRLELNYSGTAIYSMNNERRALAYIPLESNYWRLIIGLSYDTVIGQASYSFAVIVLIAAIVALVSMCVAFYFIYSRRNAELSRRQAEVQATHAIDEAKAKSDFLSRMSHELRTPLNGIVGMIELASRHGEDRQKREEYFKKIKTSSDFLVSLINDILDMAKIDNEKIEISPEPFDMKAMCQNLSDMFYSLTSDKQLDFTMDYSGLSHGCYIGDEMRIKQVVVNLLSNAVKFTDSGFVRCSFCEQQDGGNMVVISVEDSGCGISRDYVERIFAPFEQERTANTQGQPGTGLGLAICTNLVKLMGGSIAVDSTPGHGSTFTVKLPLQPTDSAVVGHLSSGEQRLDGLRLLLAEDNDINAQIAQALLGELGATVTTVVNGQLACEQFEASAAGEYDAILMDVQMPVLNGLDATRRIRASAHPDAASIPIIAMTANALSEDRAASLAAGMNDHLSKPFNIDKLCATILKHCTKN